MTWADYFIKAHARRGLPLASATAGRARRRCSAAAGTE
jgi:hypothetical protein